LEATLQNKIEAGIRSKASVHVKLRKESYLERFLTKHLGHFSWERVIHAESLLATVFFSSGG
jgi:hypothetical protein